MRCVRAKGKEILDIAALLAFPETFGMGGVTVRKLLVRRPLCLCRFRFSLPRPSRLPPLSSVFSSAGTPDFHPESRESAERPAVFDTYVGNDRNFQPMKFERRGFAVRGWPGADRRQSLHYDSYSPTDPPPTQPPACYCSPIREYNYFESMK